jgi:hypothetical protein
MLVFDEMNSTMRSCMVQQWLDTKDGFGSGFSRFHPGQENVHGKKSSPLAKAMILHYSRQLG